MTYIDREHIYIFSDILHVFECIETLNENMIFMPEKIHIVPTIKRRGNEWHMSVTFQKEPLKIYDEREL